ncbi:cytochrome c-550 PedF [Pseudomonas sp. MSSRFD41]|uniref:cytochrome c-550 PedF n=1 Tax=unclassified Pseudomonas TaxID=196821 RepID=UPI0016399607|nr:cytochrome c-550 PedF [Pseudomonas sp. MSSRFD41]MBC2659862.1 cytochrome c-550 PedF [Pseudomonas sp. MSSRFD41]
MTTKHNALLVAGLLAGALATGAAWAHGNVVPQAVETKGLTPIKDAGVTLDGDGWATVNPYRTSPEHDKAVEIGASAYNQNCAACHGLEAKSGGIAPDLRMLDAGEAGDEWFVERVRNGAVRDGRVYMPKMADYLSQEALWAVRTYLDSVRIEE